MSVYAMTYIGLCLLGLGVELQRHGQPKTGNHNVIVSLAAAAIVWTLLYLGGFFSAQ
jgi:hypothetical protein